MKPLVSIVIPVYNGSNYLKEAIDSALAQTYENCEVIVVNDGSNDAGATAEICQSYRDKIRYFEKENGGVASAINLGIKKMRGDYFAWLSHDDHFLPQKIDEQMALMTNEVQVVFGNFMFENMETKEKTLFHMENYCEECKISKGIYPILFGLIHFSTMIVSKKRIEEVGLCNESLKTTQDIEWIFRIIRNQNTGFLKEPLTVVRLHEQQGKRHIVEYDQEQGDTHIEFLNWISKAEIIELFGDCTAYYQQMAEFYKRDRNIRAYEYVRQLFMQLPTDEENRKKIEELNRQLHIYNGKKIEEICIFGIGKFGKNLLYLLKQRLIAVDILSDNDRQKWNNRVDGVLCVSPSRVKKESTLVIVALEHPDCLAEQLQKDGFKCVITYWDIIDDIEKIRAVCIPEWN